MKTLIDFFFLFENACIMIIKIRYISLELLSCQYQHFRDLFFKIEMFDLHAVSIFATGTGESDTTTPPFLQVVEHNL